MTHIPAVNARTQQLHQITQNLCGCILKSQCTFLILNTCPVFLKVN